MPQTEVPKRFVDGCLARLPRIEECYEELYVYGPGDMGIVQADHVETYCLLLLGSWYGSAISPPCPLEARDRNIARDTLRALGSSIAPRMHHWLSIGPDWKTTTGN